MKFFEVPIIGTGTREDPYRCALADLGVGYSAHIPSGLDGKPLYQTAVVQVRDNLPTPRNAVVLTRDQALSKIEARQPGVLQGRKALRGRG